MRVRELIRTGPKDRMEWERAVRYPGEQPNWIQRVPQTVYRHILIDIGCVGLN